MSTRSGDRRSTAKPAPAVERRVRNGRHTGYIGAVSYTDAAGQLKRHVVYGKTLADVRDKMKQARERLDLM
jgi:hypothetical protein